MPMAFVRKKNIKGKTYYYLVKSVREGKRVYQVNLAYLGPEEPKGEEVRKLIKKHEEQTRERRPTPK